MLFVTCMNTLHDDSRNHMMLGNINFCHPQTTMLRNIFVHNIAAGNSCQQNCCLVYGAFSLLALMLAIYIYAYYCMFHLAHYMTDIYNMKMQKVCTWLPVHILSQEV